ncbi:MAG: cytochrome c biogenesis CcdA family protein [Tissierellia bacterium]|nr:cytochrome c biogenesis CcdA family protein [Tissierellia bacterium]
MFGEELLLSSVFVAGILSFFAPCTFPLIPVYIGFMTDEAGEYKKLKIGKLIINIGAIIKTVAFVLGLSTSFVILGFGAGALGKILNNRWVLVFAGFVVFVLGIHQMDVIHLNKLNSIKGIRFKNTKKGALGTYLMGISFSLGWTPCVGPVLGAVLVTSASSGQQLYGAFLMLIYSAGLMVPFLIMAVTSSALINRFSFFERHLIKIKRIGGVLIALMGLVLMSNQLPNLTAFFNRIFN